MLCEKLVEPFSFASDNLKIAISKIPLASGITKDKAYSRETSQHLVNNKQKKQTGRHRKHTFSEE